MRRGGPPSSSLSPQDPSSPSGGSSTNNFGFPRSTSPSAGFFNSLTRPSKWFGRSASNPKMSTVTSTEPRASSSSGRKHKISRPTDPRPILDSYGSSNATRSVLDLSVRPPNSLDLSSPLHVPASPSSPSATQPPSGGLGDLRNISKRAWSRSADDLGKLGTSNVSPQRSSFEEKVAKYRGRSNSNTGAISPTRPQGPPLVSIPAFSGGVPQPPQPFPTFKPATTPPSTSPPKVSNMPSAVSISVSAPVVDEASAAAKNSPPANHVHTRSHSFTPKLASKLSAPRFPSSPKRKDSAGSEVEGQVATPTRAGFFAKPMELSKSTPAQQTHRQTTLLFPPVIVEPEGGNDSASGSADAKRSSQIVYNSGFLNRLADVPANPHHANLSNAKGWKPFKAEIKGSKLFFYKPPSDRSTAVKELFPVELVPPSPDDVEEDADKEKDDPFGSLGEGSRIRVGGRKDDSLAMRKKRAFWGRRTHPDLMRNHLTGKIEKGTLEALTHEAVFGTTFLVQESEEDQSEGKSYIQLEPWKDFASSILLCLPYLVDHSRFEVEFKRCCEYLVSGAEEDKKKEEQARVAWLVGEYLRLHGRPIHFPEWEDWKPDAIPAASGLAPPAFQSNISTSASVQGLFNPTPNASPDLGAFSPRPEDSKLVSLMDILGVHNSPGSPVPRSYFDAKPMEPHHRGHSSPLSGTLPPPWLNALDCEGLSRNLLLSIDTQVLARSLRFFHSQVYQQIPDNFTADFLMSNPPPSNNPQPQQPPPASSALFGSPEHPHWLTKLVLMQILVTESAYVASSSSNSMHAVSSPGRSQDAQTSKTHTRSEVISTWVRVGEYCRVSGDECSWRAIMTAICSPPVARLEKAWKRVDPDATSTVESWTQVTGDGESVGVIEPKITSWGGDIKNVIQEELNRASGKSGEIFVVDSIAKVRALFERYRTSFSLCRRKVPLEEGEGEDIRKLVTYWGELFGDVRNTGLAVKFQRVEQFMSLSLAAEPRRKGLYEPFFWSRSASNPQSTSSLLPLLFPEPLPTITLIDRSQLLRGRVDSDAPDIQHLRAVDGHLRPDDRTSPSDRSDGSSPFSMLSRGGTVIPVFNGELLLIVQNSVVESTPNSRPSSLVRSRPPSGVFDQPGTPERTGIGRTPSIRVKPGSSQGLDRKASLARRNSLPSLSQRQPIVFSETSADPPLRVLVQSGTLDRLVDILIHGLNNVSVSVADDNGEMSLREGSRELMLDHKEFSRIWWNVFRSFVNPLIFFELLRKAYIKSQPSGTEPSVDDYLDVLSGRLRVIETLKTWMFRGNGAQDLLDDTQLLSAFRSFMQSPTDHLVYLSSGFEDPVVQQVRDNLIESRTALERFIHSQILRPHYQRYQTVVRARLTASESRLRNLSTREPPDIDKMSPEELVDNLDGMAFATFSNVTEEDLYITADLLETQSADRTGWFLSKEEIINEDTIEIQNIGMYLQEVETSSLISEMTTDYIYRMLPPGIRNCMRAFHVIKKWIIPKIVAPKIGLRTRQARLETLLRALEVTRIRNLEGQALRVCEQPCVRSFVEAVITAAIVTPYSRLHHRAWQNVALNRNSPCDALNVLLSRPTMRPVSSKEPLTVDMGWLIERMLDVIAMPDTVEAVNMEGQNLINFDKRRHLSNFIANAPSLMSRRFAQQGDINRRGIDRLTNIEREVASLSFDLRSIKEEAYREGLTSSASASASSKKPARPFQRLVTLQLEKSRRDKSLRSRLQKEKLQEQSRQEKRDELINKAMRGRRASAVAQKQHRNKKSMSALFHFIRPISSAFGSETPQVPPLKRTVSELDFLPSGKPSLVLSLMDSRVAQFINNDRSFTFQLDTEDGGHYILQAINKKDMTKWIDTITRISNIAAKRRLTYLGSPKPQAADHIQTQPSTATRDPHAVFGVELEFLLEREAKGTPVAPGTIPSVLQRCLAEVEGRGLTEVGIYRMAGATSEIAALKEAFNRGECPILPTTDIHAICDLIKSWFRVLPEPIFPASSYHDAIAAMQLENLDDRISKTRALVQTLPQANFDLLKRISEHLDTVTDFEEQNQMTAEALSIVFSPNLLRAPQNDFFVALTNMAHTHKFVKTLITHCHVIFDDSEAEGEVDQEDDLENPIVEEDECEDDAFSIPVTEVESSQFHADLGRDNQAIAQ